MIAAFVVLGVAYGVSPFCGLHSVRELADPRSPDTATFPFGCRWCRRTCTRPVLLLVLAGLAVATRRLVVMTSRRRIDNWAGSTGPD